MRQRLTVPPAPMTATPTVQIKAGRGVAIMRTSRRSSISHQGLPSGIKSVAVPLVLVAVYAHAAGIHKWTDGQGRIHYGDQPPAGVETRVIQPAQPTYRERLAREKEERAALIQELENQGNPYAEAIRDRTVSVGMNDDDVRMAWGDPKSINRTTGIFGIHEQWVYEYGYDHDYVYLENGRVTSIQTSRHDR